jgi:hypothetical protein
MMIAMTTIVRLTARFKTQPWVYRVLFGLLHQLLFFHCLLTSHHRDQVIRFLPSSGVCWLCDHEGTSWKSRDASDDKAYFTGGRHP